MVKINPSKLITPKVQYEERRKTTKIKKIPLKKGKDFLNKWIKESNKIYDEIYKEIDKFFNEIISLIKSNNISEGTNELKKKYIKIQRSIQSVQVKLFEKVEEIEYQVKPYKEFKSFKEEKFNEFYVIESEVNEHLDRIYGRLQYYVQNPEAIP